MREEDNYIKACADAAQAATFEAKSAQINGLTNAAGKKNPRALPLRGPQSE
jgi:hypothetical protein